MPSGVWLCASSSCGALLLFFNFIFIATCGSPSSDRLSAIVSHHCNLCDITLGASVYLAGIPRAEYLWGRLCASTSPYLARVVVLRLVGTRSLCLLLFLSHLLHRVLDTLWEVFCFARSRRFWCATAPWMAAVCAGCDAPLVRACAALGLAVGSSQCRSIFGWFWKHLPLWAALWNSLGRGCVLCLEPNLVLWVFSSKVYSATNHVGVRAGCASFSFVSLPCHSPSRGVGSFLIIALRILFHHGRAPWHGLTGRCSAPVLGLMCAASVMLLARAAPIARFWGVFLSPLCQVPMCAVASQLLLILEELMRYIRALWINLNPGAFVFYLLAYIVACLVGSRSKCESSGSVLQKVASVVLFGVLLPNMGPIRLQFWKLFQEPFSVLVPFFLIWITNAACLLSKVSDEAASGLTCQVALVALGLVAFWMTAMLAAVFAC